MKSGQPNYPVFCVWCEAKGIRTVISHSPVQGSHGICPDCREQMNKDADEFKKEMEDSQ